ncbi:fam-m protein [Plasmodium malariae]|uniref:Fam-m protein n=1 Tax=Plasmodium malariae TaxID=5858 RepID=A0A1D3JGU1_PLAMA|nr:fam-m protein [Plasmodium malariae]SBT85469.1 fam-m protein [Plasmodium malariae]
MKQKKNLFIIINVAVFLPLIWIYNSNNNLSTLSESLNENSCLGRKLVTRIYRLLANYKQQYSNNVYLKKKFPNNGVNEKKDIHSNKMDITEKRKQSNRSLLNKAQYYTEIVDYNNGMFDGKHFHFEKKWIRKKDYDNFLERKRKICDITLKKIKFKNYGFGVAIFFFFFPVGNRITHISRIRDVYQRFR